MITRRDVFAREAFRTISAVLQNQEFFPTGKRESDVVGHMGIGLRQMMKVLLDFRKIHLCLMYAFEPDHRYQKEKPHIPYTGMNIAGRISYVSDSDPPRSGHFLFGNMEKLRR